MIEGWAILELLGHRRLGGIVSEETLAGVGMIRIDIPPAAVAEGQTETFTTQYYSPSALYCLTPCEEPTARAFAARNQPMPVQRWELKSLPEAVDAPWNEADDED